MPTVVSGRRAAPSSTGMFRLSQTTVLRQRNQKGGDEHWNLKAVTKPHPFHHLLTISTEIFPEQQLSFDFIAKRFLASTTNTGSKAKINRCNCRAQSPVESKALLFWFLYETSGRSRYLNKNLRAS